MLESRHFPRSRARAFLTAFGQRAAPFGQLHFSFLSIYTPLSLHALLKKDNDLTVSPADRERERNSICVFSSNIAREKVKKEEKKVFFFHFLKREKKLKMGENVLILFGVWEQFVLYFWVWVSGVVQKSYFLVRSGCGCGVVGGNGGDLRVRV